MFSSPVVFSWAFKSLQDRLSGLTGAGICCSFAGTGVPMAGACAAWP